jgi:hypothetical protein
MQSCTVLWSASLSVHSLKLAKQFAYIRKVRGSNPPLAAEVHSDRHCCNPQCNP